MTSALKTAGLRGVQEQGGEGDRIAERRRRGRRKAENSQEESFQFEPRTLGLNAANPAPSGGLTTQLVRVMPG